jgi:uncharacterized protein
VCSVLGLLIFAGVHHVRLPAAAHQHRGHRRPLLAASIFLDVLNVFLFFLAIFSGEER